MPDRIHISNVPYDKQTQSYVEWSVMMCASNLTYANPVLVTRELLDEILRIHPYNLRYIPEDMQTFDLCLNAVMKNPRVIGYVREDISNDDVFLAIVNLTSG